MSESKLSAVGLWVPLTMALLAGQASRSRPVFSNDGIALADLAWFARITDGVMVSESSVRKLFNNCRYFHWLGVESAFWDGQLVILTASLLASQVQVRVAHSQLKTDPPTRGLGTRQLMFLLTLRRYLQLAVVFA